MNIPPEHVLPRLMRARVSCPLPVHGCSIVVIMYLSGASWLFAQDSLYIRSNPSEESEQAVSVTTHGLGRYRRGKWGVLRIDATNQASVPARVGSVTWVEGQEDKQFGRSVWLPSESHRLTWQPILTPPKQPSNEHPTLYWMSVRNEGNNEVFATAENHELIESRALNLSSGAPVVAVISEGTGEHSAISGLLTYSLEQVRPQARVIQLVTSQLPVTSAAFDAAEVLVVMGDLLSQNAAAVEAVQDWVYQGGFLWLMLDTMTAESAQTICGGDLQVHELDRVSLTSYSLTSSANRSVRPADEVELERPVQLVRTVNDNVEVLSTVDDWPAIASTSFGRGRVFVSMVSLSGVFVPRSRLSAERADVLDRRLWVTTSGMDLMSALEKVGGEVPLDVDAMTEYVDGRVGYQMPSRSTGATVLILFCSALAVVCVAAQRWRRPVFFIGGVAVVSVFTIGVFLAIAPSSQSVTESAVTFQLAEATGTQDQLQVTGVTAYQTQSNTRPKFQSTAAGMMAFEEPFGSSAPVRMLWVDQSSWQLKNATLAPGVRVAEYRQTVNIQHPVVAEGTFNEAGFHGQLFGDFAGDWSDVLLADQTGFTLPAIIDSDGRIFTGGSNPLPRGEYLASGMLNAEQARRQNVYRRMFDVTDRSRIYPERTTLFAWTEPISLSTGRADEVSQDGALLISVPVTIERPASGSRFRIPSTFLPYRSVRDLNHKVGVTSNFSNARRTWTPSHSTAPSTSMLRFQIPSAMLPVSVDKVTLKLKISAPLREVTISSGTLESLVHVWSRNSPVGTFDIPFPARESRRLDSEGGLHVALGIGSVQLEELNQADQGTQDRNWQVDAMQLEIEGIVQ